jgi:hypothetical protein
MKKLLWLAAIIVSFYFLIPSFAETIVLKSGKTVEGKILEKTKDSIKIEISGVSLTYYLDEIKSITDSAAVSAQNEQSADTVEIYIKHMIKLDGSTKKEIYEMRKSYVQQYPSLLKHNYSPSDEVFGQIVDNKPWWGILGLSYYGPGEKGIMGPSEESRFLINPYLLVGLDAGHGLRVDDKNLSPIPIYPEPTKLIWSKDGAFAKVTYRIANFWRMQKRYHDASASQHMLTLIAYNAKDMGYNFLYINPEGSKSLSMSSYRLMPIAIRQFIHCGGSCGYPGGCNNMSPDQPDLQIQVSDTPALVKLKLWKNQPASIDQAADMIFIIEILN